MLDDALSRLGDNNIIERQPRKDVVSAGVQKIKTNLSMVERITGGNRRRSRER